MLKLHLAESLSETLKDTEQKLLVATKDNEKLMVLLALTHDTQCELVTEFAELKECCAEILNLLQEAQETIRDDSKKVTASGSEWTPFPFLTYIITDS